MHYKGITIFPCPELSGSTYAYQRNDEVYVSEAVYELLHDPDCKNIVLKQLKIRSLDDLIEKEFRKFEKAKRNKMDKG